MRGTSLGPWYTMEGVATRIAQAGELACITANKKLIVSATPDRLTVWLPGTRRTCQAVLPRRAATYDGTTWTIWLTADDTIPLKDPRGGYRGTLDRQDVLRRFGPGRTQWFEPVRDTRLARLEQANRLVARSEAQRHWLDWVDRRNLRLQDSIRALRAVRRWGGNDENGLTPADIRLAVSRARRETERLRRLHTALLAAAAPGGRDDQQLEDLERRAALIDQQTRLMAAQLRRITAHVQDTPDLGEERDRAGWRGLAPTARQLALLDALTEKHLITTGQQQAARGSRGAASDLIAATLARRPADTARPSAPDRRQEGQAQNRQQGKEGQKNDR